MRLTTLTGTALLAVLACTPKSQTPAPIRVSDPAAMADPRMGSGGYGFAYGASFPGATAPNGMMRIGPDTLGLYTPLGFLAFSGYWAGDETVVAFSHMHLSGTGAHDYGVLGVLPIPAFDPSKKRADDYASHFEKSSEKAEPGYYALTMDNGPVKAEMTADIHSAHERYTFPAGATTGTLLIDLDHHVKGPTVPSGTLTLSAADKTVVGELQTSGGMSGGFHLYFAMKFRKGWTSAKVFDGTAAPAVADTISGAGVGAALEFDTSDSAPIEMQIGLSLISLDGAKANLAAEMTGWDFDATRAATRAKWNDRLKVLTVTAPDDARTKRNLEMFYSSLHHLYVMPGTYSDVDGTYRYYGTTEKAQGFRFVTDLSLWDTYRTANPLYNLIAPDLALDIVQSLYTMARITGHYPKWPLATSDSGSMLGAGADIVLADAYTKGIRGFDAEAAFAILRGAAMDVTLPSGQDRGGRNAGADDYLAHGYVLAGNGASVSLTCEYSQDDFALAQFARALGKTADADALTLRSQGYRNLYDPTSGFLREHTVDGQVPAKAFNPSDFFDEQYVESDAYQSQFCVQHDVEGFAALWGGKDKFVAGLSDLFGKTKVERENAEAVAAMATPSDDLNFFAINNPPSYYFGGNEPDVHYAYLFAQAGRPDLTQQWVPWVRDHYFAPTPAGLSGNDDGGTMSSWFIFSALGIYPVPGSDLYIVGTPLFPKVEMTVGTGTFTFVANNVSEKNIYIQSVKLNGQPLTTPKIHHADLKAGGSLTFEMGSQPGTWGRAN